ncbi:hypothetical protein [Salmonella enterica]|uniref:13.88 kDa late protein n=1 Tax=Salmonella phage FSL SP-101 TaxID=1173752 RepID=S4TSR7_9CAUD|nr:hypothetical protein FDI93_gp39 [Salmonella phage FSL SP-101]EAY2344672.1 hypothetical protein [Salmonella enterica subsp. enterica serovar Dublin]ELE8256277.1 hypothetical protein [Salmonella enterica]AGF87742.1 hypothetical protein SP101_00195 [Salmonella phage FSL SP-101]ECU4628514.1 hypothetical protein [Salmonella enterica subsp. enterica serovar Dublin]ECX0577972.1 hypothetical protein [Salmonella enterica subsp. enterica serovar Dublin]
MLEKFLVLLERFVVAHERIAANSAKEPVIGSPEHFAEFCKLQGVSVKEALTKPSKEIPVEGEDIVDTKPVEEEKPKRKPRKPKVEEPTPEPEEEIDYKSLRDQIQAIDDAINEGPSDAACDDSDELLEEFTGKKMKIAAIKDEYLAEYLERLTAIKNKYFEEE